MLLLDLSTALPAKFDVSKILQRGTRESQKLVDGGTGKVEVWVTEKSEMVPLDPRMYGHFFAEDTYVILYTYTTDTERYIIYFWLGQVCYITVSASYMFMLKLLPSPLPQQRRLQLPCILLTSTRSSKGRL